MHGFRFARVLLVAFACVAATILPSSRLHAHPTRPAPRDAAADAARVEELTTALLEADGANRIKECPELRDLPLGSAALEDRLFREVWPKCAADGDPQVRAAAASVIGGRYLAALDPPDPRAVALCLKLAADPERPVRKSAVVEGLARITNKSDEVVAALIARAVADPRDEDELRNPIQWGLSLSPADQVARHVEPYLAKRQEAPERALLAYTVYVNATLTEPPGAERVDGLGPFVMEFDLRAPAPDVPTFMAIVRHFLPEPLAPTFTVRAGRHAMRLTALVPNVKARRDLLERLQGLEWGKEMRVDNRIRVATPEMVEKVTADSKKPLPTEGPEPVPQTRPIDEYARMMATGDSDERGEALEKSNFPDLLTKQEAGLDLLVACAMDANPGVREKAARLAGEWWVWYRDPPHPRALALSLKLAKDPEPKVVGTVAYFALPRVKNPPDAVVDAMITAATTQTPWEPNGLHFITAYGLRNIAPERLETLLTPIMRGADEQQARHAFALFVESSGREPANPERFQRLRRYMLWFGARDRKFKTPQELLDAFREYAPAEQVPEVAVTPYGEEVAGGAVLTDLAALKDLNDRLRQDPRFSVGDRPQVMNPERVAYLRYVFGLKPEGVISTIDMPKPGGYDDALRELHAHLGRVYPAFKIKGIDWDKVGGELLPLASEAKTDAEFGLLCARMVARLEDSHAQLLPGSAPLPFPTIEFPRYDPGFACLIDDRDRPVVYHVDKGSPAEAGGVKVGMAVVSVNGKPAAEAMAAWMGQMKTYFGYSSERYLRYDAAKGFCRQTKQGEVVKLEMEDAEGEAHAFELPATLNTRYLPRLPVPIEGIDDFGNVESKKLADDIGYIYVRRIQPDLPQRLDAALAALGDIKGLVIDVRGNSGGGFDARAAVRNFNPDDPEEPSRPRYKGPIALLVDERCISAGEGWASWFVATKRATLFGTTTAGASARKDTYTLTNGMYKVVVPVKAYTGSLDRPIERRGLEPDVPVRCNAKDLAQGKDTVLEAARASLLKR